MVFLLGFHGVQMGFVAIWNHISGFDMPKGVHMSFVRVSWTRDGFRDDQFAPWLLKLRQQYF